MGHFDNENNIIEYFRCLDDKDLWPLNTDCVEILECIREDNWRKWKDSSGKSDLPPDFYSEEYSVMMDVMRIDDHTHKNKKGKKVNHTYAKESMMMKELKDSGWIDLIPKGKFITNGDSGLQTKEDHNYTWYKKNFIDVLSKHISKIDNYKKNHPGYKLVFFVFDESSTYFESLNVVSEKDMVVGNKLSAKPHIHFLDKSFIDVIKGSEVDYLIWFTPFKKDEIYSEFPKAVILDLSDLPDALIEYTEIRMISNEV
ncbi:hypothetical protein BFC19_07555 [Brochothrix thermosphacta]|uniref:hypothetical protein n=1 Tax=Brochothrix thermosphacta TaxID=2756 RepID=UPI000E72BDC9|nr:hypothetical protein [Brochothrix thermosphacta]ANZ95244.1 hypothetical protein BFC19_07555 [Brochothrix thermosphacta]